MDTGGTARIRRAQRRILSVVTLYITLQIVLSWQVDFYNPVALFDPRGIKDDYLIRRLAMKMTKVILLLISFSLFSCHSDEGPCLTCPPPYIQSIFLDTLSSDLTTITFRLHLIDSSHTSTVQLYRDSIRAVSVSIRATDTVLVDNFLLPEHAYRYKAYRLQQGVRVDSSKFLIARTMDTTSHDFTWEIATLGDGNSSALYNVAIVNDTLAYAVGELYLKDSTGRFDSELYNLAVWNGKVWKLLRLYYEGYTPVIRTIAAISENDIWMDPWFHWDGREFVSLPVDSVFLGHGITGLWGNPQGIYAIGYGGFIAYFNGHSWQRMTCPTNMDLTDVYGSSDGTIIWTCGYFTDQMGTYLFRNVGTGWQLAYDGTTSELLIRPDSLSGAFTSTYAPTANKVFVSTPSGIYLAEAMTSGKATRISFTPSYFPGFPYKLRGNGTNDLTVVGENQMVAHYNGSTLKYYSELAGNSRWVSVAQNGNLVLAVGYSYDAISQATVLVGKR